MSETLKTDITKTDEQQMVSDPLTLHTEDGLVLKQYTTPEDDVAYMDIQDRNREHIAEFGNKIYTAEEATEARLNPNGIIRMGIWKKDKLIGEISVTSLDSGEAETGIWLAKDATGQGYATSALNTVTKYANSRFSRVVAEIDVKNEKSIDLYKRVGYYLTGRTVERSWSNEPALVFEFPQNLDQQSLTSAPFLQPRSANYYPGSPPIYP
jgi:RimJ/RimL family protein N-acetyltransferase